MEEQNHKKPNQLRTLKSKGRKFKTTPFKKKSEKNVNEQTEGSARKNLSNFMDNQAEYSERKNSIFTEINEITGPQSVIESFENFMSTLSFGGCAHQEQSKENLISEDNLEWNEFVMALETTVDGDQNLPLEKLTNNDGEIFF